MNVLIKDFDKYIIQIDIEYKEKLIAAINKTGLLKQI